MANLPRQSLTAVSEEAGVPGFHVAIVPDA